LKEQVLNVFVITSNHCYVALILGRLYWLRGVMYLLVSFALYLSMNASSVRRWSWRSQGSRQWLPWQW